MSTVPEPVDVLEAAKPWMQQCGPHDYGIQAGSCGCPPDGDPRPIVSKLAGELEAARKALLDVTDVFGYHLTNDEVAEQIREGWQGVPQRVAEDLSELRAKVSRVEALLSDPYQEPPANGQLVIVGTQGGHQNLPYRERVYQRSDRVEKAYADGDWYGIEGDAKDYPLTYGELNWLDDPPCDRGSVTVEGPYVHVEDIAKALAGEPS